jgi:uncharacterized protein YjbJ (UPF0337 family)
VVSALKRSGSASRRDRGVCQVFEAAGMTSHRVRCRRASGIPTLSKERDLMSDSGPVAAVKGILEDGAGKVKEIVGIIIDHDGLHEEGCAQQDEAKAQRDVAKKES